MPAFSRRFSDRQSRFILAYVECGNATAAAIEAGYSPATAGRIAGQLLARPNIRAEIERRQGRIAKRLEISAERTTLALARICYADPRRLFDNDGRLKRIIDLDDDTAGAVASVEVTKNGKNETITRIRLASRTEAAAVLSRYFAGNLRTEQEAEAARLREIMSLLSDDELADLERIGRHLEQLASAPQIDGVTAARVEESCSPRPQPASSD